MQAFLPGERRESILCVDDTPANLQLLHPLLKDSYRVRLANSGAAALEAVERETPDLILLDIMMPGMDGYEVLRRLKADPRFNAVPVIFLTAMSSPKDEERGLLAGAADFVTKPIVPPVLLARVRSHLASKQWRDFLLNRNQWLEAEVERRLNEINRMQDTSILVMTSLAEFRDEDTGNHIRRTQLFVELLANDARQKNAFASALDDETLHLIVKSAPLHDIGKIAIPDHILLKPGKLTDEEFAIMKTHTVKGYNILTRAVQNLADSGRYLEIACQITRSHHEKWDGSGYPDGLSGEAIPLPARLMALADVYDALRSARPYKKPFSHEQALSLIREGQGRHFDPRLCALFLDREKDIANVHKRLHD